jgi:hypothetical protein
MEVCAARDVCDRQVDEKQSSLAVMQLDLGDRLEVRQW